MPSWTGLLTSVEKPLEILALHDISAILNQTQLKHLSTARHLRLQCSLLLPNNVTISKCTVLNPPTLLPLPRGDTDTDPQIKSLNLLRTDDHDCFSIMQQETAGLPKVAEEPLTNPELILYVDGSRFADDEGRFHTGGAATSNQEILWSRSLPPSLSAQEAELIALMKAYQMAEDKTEKMYTDSRYLHGTAHDFGPIWAARDFLTASGTTVKHNGAIKDLLNTLQLPKVVTVLKVKAHGKLNTVEARGNNMVNMAAKEAVKGRQYGQVEEVVEPDGYYRTAEDRKPDKMTSWDLLKKVARASPKGQEGMLDAEVSNT
ncbi:uncharacterized protein LOC143807061 [Ranitomeya variabilis]|uniref:uncharacterized protein LOC143807061 n=1 Tax=Ranitomeya variabilis TaxID=490064 RepID=UPI004057AD35